MRSLIKNVYYFVDAYFGKLWWTITVIMLPSFFLNFWDTWETMVGWVVIGLIRIVWNWENVWN